MPDFSAKMHQIQFRLGLHPDPTGEPSIAGWVMAGCPLSKNTYTRSRPLGPRYSFFLRPHHLSSLNQKLGKKSNCLCAQRRHVILSWIDTPLAYLPLSHLRLAPLWPAKKISHRANNATLEKLPQLFCIFLCYIHKKTTQCSKHHLISITQPSHVCRRHTAFLLFLPDLIL